MAKGLVTLFTTIKMSAPTASVGKPGIVLPFCRKGGKKACWLMIDEGVDVT